MKKMKRVLVLVMVMLLYISMTENYTMQEKSKDNRPQYLKTNTAWVDSVMQTMTLEEKVGQLFMIAAYSNKDAGHENTIESTVKKYHIGGLIFFQGSPSKQAKLTNQYQEAAKYPLLIGMDAEWGLGMRLDSVISYPRQLLLGAVKDDELIVKMGKLIGQQLRRLGVHINFAPVIDVNNNPNNPVINDRSFGENKINVTKKGIAYMKGLEAAGVLPCGKHFPGHGDTDVDSHYDLPLIKHDTARLNKLELFPFIGLINEGLGSIMVAHLNIPSLDSKPNLPSTLSPKIVTDLLKKKLEFKGIIFTDALNMKGVTKYFAPGEVEVEAIKAGNDVLLFSENVPAGYQAVLNAVKAGKIAESRIDESVKKILHLKKWMGLFEDNKVKMQNLTKDLNKEEDLWFRRTLIENAITVVRDSNYIIPIRELSAENIACVTIGRNSATAFDNMVDKYAPIKHYYIDKNADSYLFDKLLKDLAKHSLVLVNLQNMSRFASSGFGLTSASVQFLKQLDKQKRTITSVFGTPYALEKLKDLQHIIIAYEESKEAQELTAQIIFGARVAKGKIPVSAGGYKEGRGLETIDLKRLKYGSSLDFNIPTHKLGKLDSIVERAIRIKATPGCQVMFAKDGIVFYNKNFGSHTYEANSKKVESSDIYDIASITKIASTTIMLMKLYEEGKVDVEASLGKYLDLPESSDKRNLIIKDILTHQAGLEAWIPFYMKTITPDKKPNPNLYSNKQDDYYCIKVTNNLFICQNYVDTIFMTIDGSKLSGQKKYKYSDLGFYLFKEMIEKIENSSLALLVENKFYKPLGMTTMTYLPDEKFPMTRIVPTEDDKTFRTTTVQGFVHDQGAALLGGVGGHAGLFSNANDLVILMQMLLNGGIYGGVRYFEKSTIDFFTKAPFTNNRRALGFDKPTGLEGNGPTSTLASSKSYGHSGFTGTLAWADPENNMVFVFLSNRVYPSAENKKLITDNVRSSIQHEAYKLFMN